MEQRIWAMCGLKMGGWIFGGWSLWIIMFVLTCSMTAPVVESSFQQQEHVKNINKIFTKVKSFYIELKAIQFAMQKMRSLSDICTN